MEGLTHGAVFGLEQWGKIVNQMLGLFIDILGKLKLIISKVTISNSICFSIDKKYCYFSDTAKKNIMRIELDSDNGSPIKNSEIFIDLADEAIAPDGSVVDGQEIYGMRSGDHHE